MGVIDIGFCRCPLTACYLDRDGSTYLESIFLRCELLRVSFHAKINDNQVGLSGFILMVRRVRREVSNRCLILFILAISLNGPSQSSIRLKLLLDDQTLFHPPAVKRNQPLNWTDVSM